MVVGWRGTLCLTTNFEHLFTLRHGLDPDPGCCERFHMKVRTCLRDVLGQVVPPPFVGSS